MMKQQGLIAAMPGCHPLNKNGLISMCHSMGWKCQVVSEKPREMQEGVTFILESNFMSSANPELAPFSHHKSYWKRVPTDQEGFSYIHYLNPSDYPRLSSAGYFRRHRLGPMTRMIGPVEEKPNVESGYCVTSNKIDPRDTPLRYKVHEFLRRTDMQWLNQIMQPLTFEQWSKRFPLHKREKLEKALIKAKRWDQLPPKLTKVKNFLKRETTEKFVDPRNISPREDEFMVIMGPYISAIEKRAHDAPFLVKGLSMSERCKKLDWLRDFDRFIEVDFSRFDMTISQEILEIVEHLLLRHPFPDAHPDFLHCLRACLRTSGVSQFGTKYNVDGTRCSGDVHTSIANGLLNRFLTWLCLASLPVNAWNSVHEGDDGIIAIHHKYLDQAMYNLQFLKCLGFDAKLKVSNNLSEVVFCGRRFVETPSGLTDMCDVTRALRKYSTTMSEGSTDILLYCKSLSYNWTDRDTPIIGALSYNLVKILRSRVDITKSKTKRYLARVLNERWVTHSENVTIPYEKLINMRKPDVCADKYAALLLTEQFALQQVYELEKEYMSWEFVPNEISKVPLEWANQPDNVQTTMTPHLHLM